MERIIANPRGWGSRGICILKCGFSLRESADDDQIRKIYNSFTTYLVFLSSTTFRNRSEDFDSKRVCLSREECH